METVTTYTVSYTSKTYGAKKRFTFANLAHAMQYYEEKREANAKNLKLAMTETVTTTAILNIVTINELATINSSAMKKFN